MAFIAPMPVQEQVIPLVLEGRDVVASAQTGTGKTAAFLIPMIEGLLTMPRAAKYRPLALVLAPTRELAQQVAEHFRALAKQTRLRVGVIYGGVDIGEQDRALTDGAELVVATPGRLLEHLDRGELKFTKLEYLVIDEADRLLDAGFLPDVRRIVDALPERRQTLLFSATMPEEMEKLAREILSKPARVAIGIKAPRDTIRESFWPVPEAQKFDLLQRLLAAEEGLEKVLLFVRTRAKAREYLPTLKELTNLAAAELHADLSQAERDATLRDFREGRVQLLVATDVASRGLDIEGLTHVVNHDVPNTPDDYIHRVGRTGRVDRPGVAITLVSPKELALATGIEAVLRRPVPWKRLDGFAYIQEEGTDAKSLLKPRRKQQGARSFTERPAVGKDGKKENPFTRSGQLKKKFRDPSQEEEKPRKRKRDEARFLKKKLPHQRKHK